MLTTLLLIQTLQRKAYALFKKKEDMEGKNSNEDNLISFSLLTLWNTENHPLKFIFSDT